MKLVFGAFALVSVLTTAGIVLTLIFETFEFFQAVPLWNFLTDTQWTPLFADAQFGIFVLISATIMTTTIAILLALPVGLMAAIYLSEYAGPKTRKRLKPALEILAGGAFGGVRLLCPVDGHSGAAIFYSWPAGV